MKKNISKTKNESTKVKNGLRIAYLGWGSLLSSASRKKLNVTGAFNAKGPEIPLEFTRISNDGRLTLVIDEDAGKANQVFFAISRFKTINKAFDALVSVEKINPKRVGVVDIANKQSSESSARHATTTIQIAEWAKKNKIDVVLWSALGRKFKDKIGVKFTPGNAVGYLAKLSEKEREASLKYIKALPKNINTPVKELVEKEF